MVIFNALQSSMSGGLGRYCYELSRAIYETKKIEIKIIIREQDLCKFEFAYKDDLIVIKGIENSKDRNYFEQFKLPKMINKYYEDAILHSPDIMVPLLCKNRNVMTVHDMAFRSFNGAFTLKSKLWKNLIINLSIKKADRVLVVSDFTKSEVVRYFHKYNNKIETVHIGFNNFSNDNINFSNVRKGILEIGNSNYIFTVNTISPRKNTDGIVKAFNNIKDKIDANLVIAGKKGWLYEDVFKLVDEMGINDRVIFTDEINEDELKYLYKNSNIFVYCSYYEGFGLPPLEAMSYGIPCVVSDKTSIPEIVGDAAKYANPYSIEDISEKMLQLINSEEEKIRIQEIGYERIKNFSWQKCAEDTIAVYKSLEK